MSAQTTNAPASPGMFQTADGAVYRVVLSKAHKLYAKRLNTSGGFEYAPGAIFKIAETDRMTLEQAKAFGRRFGVCIKCGAMLVDPASIAAGIGPVCAKGEDGYWSAAEREAAKVALDWDAETERRRDERAPLAAANREAAPEPEPEPEPAGTLTIAENGKTATLVSGYDPAAVESCRSIPGRTWNSTDKVNVFKLNTTTVPMLQQLADQYGYEIVGSFPDVSATIAQRAANVEGSTAVDADVAIEGLGGELLPFQRAGVAFAVANSSTLIADEMGLGKTVQALATIQATESYPALVIVPAVVKLNWERETEKWLPGRRVAVLSGRNGNADALDTYDVVVVNYDIVAARKDELKKVAWKLLVCDESHYLKNGKAQRTKAVASIARKVERVVFLTGTPVLNRPIELISQLSILGVLDEFGGTMGFRNRFCDPTYNGYAWDYKGSSNVEELHERLRRVCMIRRTKEQVLTELPAKRRATVPLPLSDRAAYERVERDLREFIASKLAADEEFAAIIADLDPDDAEAAEAAELERRERKAAQAEVLTRINALRQTTARLKLDAAIAWVRDFTETGSKLVLFAHHREIVSGLMDALAAAGIGAVKLTGETTGEARQAAVDRFQTDDSIRVFVGNIAAAGVGITLTAASDVAFVELPWRPGDVDQAEDRCHRIGQHDSVTAWYLLAERTMDEDMAELIDAKRAVIEGVTDGRDVPTTSIIAGLLGALAGRGEAA